MTTLRRSSGAGLEQGPGPGSLHRGGMRRRLMLLAGLLPAVFLPADPGAAEDAGQGTGWDAAAVAAPDTTMLLRVERMGGFAGVHESWTLRASGKVWFMPVPGVEASVVRTLGSDLMGQVRGMFEAGMGRAPAGVPGVECSDCFFYRVVVVGPGESRDIVVGERRLAEASPELRRIVGLVTGQGPPPFTIPAAGGLRGGLGTPGARGD